MLVKHSLLSPLFFRLMLSAVITGLRPVNFPFEVFVFCNLAGGKFIFSHCPLFQELIQHAVIKPEDCWIVRGPGVIVMIIEAGIIGLISFFSRKPLQLVCVNQGAGVAGEAELQEYSRGRLYRLTEGGERI